MYFCTYISILFYNVYSTNGETEKAVITVADIAEAFLTLFNNDDNPDGKRIKDLKDKLSKIDSYVLDKNKYAELILNATKQNDLNQTNFYKALLGQDHFRLLNHRKNLYLTLKEKINSDDVFKILSERGENKIKKSARRMLSGSIMLKRQREKELAETVDKYLAEIAEDDHTFNRSMKYSKFWDPERELKDRQKHYQFKSRRIYKGERTTILYYPFVVSIHMMGRFWCGGSLFWHDLVITSAACLQLVHNNRFYRENPKALEVRVGSNHSRFEGEMLDALEVFFHPSYNPKTLNGNIALIRLRRHVRLNYHRVPKLLPISHNDQGIPFTAKVLLLGWGVTKITGKFSVEPMFLHKKILPIYPATYCKEIYGERFNPSNMFCAGTITTGEGACNHDAGGPALLNGKLVGIISYGPTACGFPDAPTVLTLVGFYADWIETINETLPGYYRAHFHTSTTTENFKHLYAEWNGKTTKDEQSDMLAENKDPGDQDKEPQDKEPQDKEPQDKEPQIFRSNFNYNIEPNIKIKESTSAEEENMLLNHLDSILPVTTKEPKKRWMTTEYLMQKMIQHMKIVDEGNSMNDPIPKSLSTPSSMLLKQYDGEENAMQTQTVLPYLNIQPSNNQLLSFDNFQTTGQLNLIEKIYETKPPNPYLLPGTTGSNDVRNDDTLLGLVSFLKELGNDKTWQ